jgi:long-subunit fatty acid transport protein
LNAARICRVAAIVCAAAAARAGAQSPDRAIEFEDFGFDRPLHASVRGAALSAFDAIANDATALAYNPAGLARAKRVSVTASFLGARSSFYYSYQGDGAGTELDEYAIPFVGAAFPLPVLRGSLVPAVGLQRVYSSSLEISYQGYNAPDARDDRFALQQSGATYAYHFGAGIDLSGAFSAGVDFMVLDGGIDRVRQYDMRGRVVDPNVHTFVYEDTDADVDGYGARFGLVFYAFEHAQLGVSLTTPMAVEVEANVVTETTRQVDNDVGTFSRASTSTTTDYRTPYAIEGALALPASPSLLFTAQVGYADWSKATIDEERLITSSLQSVMRSVLDVRAGVEWTLSRWPVRVRAGFAQSRGATDFLEADRIDNDRIERIGEESETRRYSVGLGWLVRGSIVIDAAAAYGHGARASATIDDQREAASLSIGCGYYF